MEEYVTSRVSSKNYKDIRYLFKERGLNYSEEFIEKKFNTSFTGIRNIGFLAYHASTGEPAAHYSVFPCLIQKKEKKILAAQSGDTITHARHQQKGLFVELANQCFDLARESGVEIIYGFPNPNSYHGLINRLNWIHSESFTSFHIPVQALPVFTATSKLKISRAAYRAFIKLLTVKNIKTRSSLLNSVVQEGFSGVDHSIDFFDYKTYLKNYIVKIDEVLIWFKLEYGILIGDIHTDSEFDGEQILASLRKLAKFTGNQKIKISVSPGTKMERFLSKSFAGLPGLPICVLNLTPDFLPGEIKFTQADSDTF